MTWASKDFYAEFAQPGTPREAAVVKEVLKGNVPTWMFKMVEVPTPTGIVKVTCDYLAIGTDDDFVRCPLTPFAAQYLANKLGYQLPSPMLVDLTYKNAQVKLPPQPTDWYKNDSLMRLGSNYIVFNNTIQTQLSGVTASGLISGHKKDIVFTPLLNSHQTSVAIYGWHQTDMKVIQPLFLGHSWTYEDYSHGIRFVQGPSNAFEGPCCIKAIPRDFVQLVEGPK